MAARKKIIELVPTPVATEIETISTTDLYFAAYCMMFAKLVRAVPDGSRLTFTFSGVGVVALRDSWFDLSGVVPALSYANSLNNLKQLIFETQKRPRAPLPIA